MTNGFLPFIKGISNRSWISTCLFLSASVALWYFNGLGFELTDSEKALPGIATFEKVDLAKRVAAYYKTLGLFSFLLISTGTFLSRLSRTTFWSSVFQLWHPVSAFGLVLLFVEQFGSSQGQTLALVWVILPCLAVVHIGAKVESPKSTTILGAGALGLSLCLTIHFIAQHVFFARSGVSIVYTFPAAFLLIYYTWNRIPNWFQMLGYLAPLIVLLSTELTWVLNTNGYKASRLNTLLITLPVSIVIVYLLRRRFDSSSPPLLLLALSGFLLGGYAPIVEPTAELFETANPANAVMRSFLFGEWPFVHYLNSHLLSELVFRFLFVAFNGYSGTTDFLAYDFLHQGIVAWVSFSVLKRLLGDSWWACVLCLAFPWLSVLIPPVFSISLVTIFLLWRNVHKATLVSSLALFGWLIFVILWRIDLGFSNTVSALVILGIFATVQRGKCLSFLRSLSVSGLVLLVLLGSIFLIIDAFSSVNLMNQLALALDYFGAAQAHGFAKLAHSTTGLFSWHHYVFPVVVIIILLLASWQWFQTRSLTFHQLFILFTGVFILANGQRGLVRHGFMENTDLHLSSFFFLLSFTFLLWVKPKRPVVALILITPMLSAFKVPSVKHYTNAIARIHEPISNQLPIAWTSRTRIPGGKEMRNEVAGELNKLMSTHFLHDATFLDMSNTPMLYFYSDRMVPSYFNQYLQNTVTPKLQESNLQRLAELEIPVVVFSRIPESWWDNTDGVPNTLRYYPISQFIYEEYEPFTQLNKRAVWIRKGLHFNHSYPVLDSLEVHQAKLHKLGYHPELSSSMFGETESICTLNHDSNFTWHLPPTLMHSTHQLLKVNAGFEGSHKISVELMDDSSKVIGTYQFKSNSDLPTDYLIPVSSQYNWLSLKPTSLRIQFDGEMTISKAEIVVVK